MVEYVGLGRRRQSRLPLQRNGPIENDENAAGIDAKIRSLASTSLGGGACGGRLPSRFLHAAFCQFMQPDLISGDQSRFLGTRPSLDLPLASNCGFQNQMWLGKRKPNRQSLRSVLRPVASLVRAHASVQVTC